MEEISLSDSARLNLQHQFEELKQRASTDSLSGLLNRDTMEQHIRNRLQEMSPEETCALFIVDLDDFKQVNDTLGHRAGDQAIRKAARILSGLFRASDIVGRLGGDEFAIFLCGRITAQLARQKGADICRTLQLAMGTNPVINLTASVGIYLSDGSQQFEGMYQSADLALYKAKKAGKHGFCLKSDDQTYQGESGEPLSVNAIPLNGLLECMDCGVALVEMGEFPRVIYVSPSFCRILGTSLSDYALPILLSDLIHPDDQVALEQTLRDGLQLKQPVEYTHRIFANGSHRWLWWHIRAVRITYDNPYPVMLITTTDISSFKEREKKLEEVNVRLQAAFDQTVQRLWEVDIPTKTFNAFEQDGMTLVKEISKVPFPDGMIDCGWIHPSSASRFREFAQEMLAGQSQGSGNFILMYRGTSSYRWVSLSYRILFDEVGRASKAIGVTEDLPKSFSVSGSDGVLRRPLPEGMLSDLMLWMRANLTQDVVEELWAEGKDLNSLHQGSSYSDVSQLERDKVLLENGQENPLEEFTRDRLLALYRDGRRWLSVEYRRADNGGNIRWVRHALHLTQDPASDEIFLFVYLTRMDLRRQWERILGGKAVRDPVTRLYSRNTIQMIGEAMFTRREYGDCAVAFFQTNGPEAGEADAYMTEQSYADIATALSVTLGSGCLLGQYSPNQILVLIPSVSSRSELRRRLEEAMSFIRQLLSGMPVLSSLRFIFGVAVQSESTPPYSVLLSQASHICAQLWNAASDSVVFSHEDSDWSWPQLENNGETDRVAVHSDEMRRPLSAGEKDVAFHCLSAMLSADSLESSLHNVLRTLGIYYKADRVYILTLQDKNRVITMPFEWTDPNKRSIRQAVSGMHLESFPLLERCMTERAPVFLTRTHPLTTNGCEGSDVPWYFTTFPLIRHGKLEGFLCIENSQEHPADAALFSTLIPYMLREQERFHGTEEAAGAVERLMGIPNLRSYMDTIYTLSSDRFNSLGAVCLDIPGMAAINGSLGFEYGSKLLWYVCQTLTELFGASFLYRTWETEFVAFCPNTTQQVFMGRCSRLLSILQRRYPKETRIGHAWSDGIFTGNNLVEEARSVMRSKHALPAADPQTLLQERDIYTSVEAAVHDGRFAIYYQPKIDMRTGALFGAEALVRGIGDDGSVIPPSRFISALEDLGSIRELDLFVLDHSLAQWASWKEQGLNPVPISVNLSRVTLLHPSTLASILAVQSRYPQIPSDALELEITESAGSVEAAEFQDLVCRFRSCGLKLSLDDFGSQYANLPLFTNVKFDAVKLDKGLITELSGNPINRMLIRDIVQICRICGMTCIAEGVETQEQINALLDSGCNYAQGYYYDRPLPAEQFELKYLRGDSSAQPDLHH